MLTSYKGKIKEINYEIKFSTISIFKNEIDKSIFEKKIIKKFKKKKESKTLWITIVIHSAIGVG